ncbi:MAG TPA: MAPEG family protein [Luteimonas sp.]|nr:MAPEG family protein [Luteimonas sp.]
MSDRAILFPALAMVALTIVVWFRMYTSRVAEMKRERIHPQAVATSAQMAARITDSRASDNFRNLFELPVLFYVALLVLALIGQVTSITLLLAWLFVALRVLHSAIHCTYNRVVHRFYAYLAGSVALWALWGVIAFNLLAG